MEAKKVNIYFVPNDKNKKGGRFYNVYVNQSERLDLSPFLNSIVDIDDLDDKVREEDESFKKTGGIIIKSNEEIESATVYSSSNGEVSLSAEEQSSYERWMALDKLSDELYNQRKQEMDEFIASQRLIDERLARIQAEKKKISGTMKETLGKTKSRGAM